MVKFREGCVGRGLKTVGAAGAALFLAHHCLQTDGGPDGGDKPESRTSGYNGPVIRRTEGPAVLDGWFGDDEQNVSGLPPGITDIQRRLIQEFTQPLAECAAAEGSICRQMPIIDGGVQSQCSKGRFGPTTFAYADKDGNVQAFFGAAMGVDDEARTRIAMGQGGFEMTLTYRAGVELESFSAFSEGAVDRLCDGMSDYVGVGEHLCTKDMSEAECADHLEDVDHIQRGLDARQAEAAEAARQALVNLDVNYMDGVNDNVLELQHLEDWQHEGEHDHVSVEAVCTPYGYQEVKLVPPGASREEILNAPTEEVFMSGCVYEVDIRTLDGHRGDMVGLDTQIIGHTDLEGSLNVIVEESREAAEDQ